MSESINEDCKKKPLVSVIIPAKNESRWLPLCLDALNRQNTRTGRIEIIVVDNGSTDNTVQIAEERGALVLYEPTLKIAGLRNSGATRASGSLLGFVDADVEISEGWLEAGLKCLGDVPGIGCAGSFPHVPESFGWVPKSWWYLQMPVDRGSAKVFDVEWIPSMNMIVRKEAFEQVYGFRTDLVTCEDVDFCYRLRENHRILYCPDMKALHYGEANNLRHLFRKERWRGISNYDGLRYHGLKMNEIPSLLLPIYYVVVSLWLTVSLLGLSRLGVIGALIAGIAPPAIKALSRGWQSGEYQQVPHMTVVGLVYCAARTVGALDWLRSKLLSR